MAKVEFIKVTTEDQQRMLADMAASIWNEYWPPIIGQAQTSYMVEKFQTFEAIERDMSEHDYEYWFITYTDEDGISHNAGYTGGHTEKETNRFFISKIYLYAEYRGLGLCSRTIALYEKLCQTRNLDAMYLTVHKHNELGMRAYRGNGFKIIEAVMNDIGKGFVMDDYIMEKRI